MTDGTANGEFAPGAQYPVLWADTAEQDLRRIVAYAADDSPTTAGQIYQDIKEAPASLKHLPLRGRVVPEFGYYGVLTYREVIHTPWRLIYRLQDDTVWILAVIDGRRNIEDVLFDRFAY